MLKVIHIRLLFSRAFFPLKGRRTAAPPCAECARERWPAPKRPPLFAAQGERPRRSTRGQPLRSAGRGTEETLAPAKVAGIREGRALLTTR